MHAALCHPQHCNRAQTTCPFCTASPLIPPPAPPPPPPASLPQAKKENNPALTAQLEGALKVAFQAKQRTLRPEIQMLNRLLALSSKDAVRQVGSSRRAGSMHRGCTRARA